MEKGMLYGLGVGPGDPELLTRKAVRLLGEADVIAVPDKGTGEKTALAIVGEFAPAEKLLFCPTPMVRDRQTLDRAYDAIADTLADLLDRGKTVAFITLGDPSVYSTYMYVHQRMTARGYRAELVPGVPSFCAVAARLGISLCEREERLLIVPASHKDISDCLDMDANLVFMKAGRELGALREALDRAGRLEGASLIENCGMDDERIYPRFADMEAPGGYFSVVVAKGGRKS
ncbi:MAG: precorrin-2 C(20)-methyltransferase [Eubacteriales bacterium]|nr:precorrin-2 C(20)-methyltransferase [Eubacteriales bacterium]